jgi:hypothetical protein
VAHDDPARVARQTLRRSGRNARPLVEDRLANLIGVGKYGGVDVNDHLVALARRAGIDAVVERRLGKQRERVSLLLLHRRRVVRRGWVGVRRPLAPMVEGLAGRLQRFSRAGRPALRGESSTDPYRAVFVLTHVQETTRVVARGLLRLGIAVDAAPAPHDALDVLGGAGAADGQQPLLGGRGCDAGQLADLGVRELAPGERLSQMRQRAERAGHADVLAGCARREAHTPGQPGGARAEAVGPAAAGIELADEIEEAGGARVEMSRELGDLVTEAIEVRGRVSLLLGTTLYPSFGAV